MDFCNLTTYELKAELRKRDLPTSGLKSELVNRLISAVGQTQDELDDVRMESSASNKLVDNIGEGELNIGDSASQMGMSRASCRSGAHSTVSSTRVIEAAKRAGLEAKVKLLKAKQLKEQQLYRLNAELKEKEFILKQEMELLDMEAQIEELAVKERVLKGIEEKVESGSRLASGRIREKGMTSEVPNEKDFDSNSIAAHASVPEINAIKNSMTKPHELTFLADDRNSKGSHLVETLISYNLKSLMPKIEIQAFSGDYTQYRSFITCFDNAISSKLSGDNEKLQYLVQFTKGKPHEIAAACLHMNKELGYKEARKQLDERYGDVERIASSYVEKILNWPTLRNEDVNGMDELSLLMVGCRNAMSSLMCGWGEVDHPRTLCRIIQKFPVFMQDRWRRQVYNLKVEQNRLPLFSDLVELISKEVKILSHPLFGKNAFKNEDSARNRFGCHSSSMLKHDKVNHECSFCRGEHYLEYCDELRKLSKDSKIKFVMDNRLCFKCLRRGHGSKDCRNVRICKICKGRHPTSLHYGTENLNQTNSNSRHDLDNVPLTGQVNRTVHSQLNEPIQDTLEYDSPGMEDVRITRVNSKQLRSARAGRMMIIPVKIKANNGREVSTLAFIDSGSDATFCTVRLLEKLGVVGKPANIVLSTIHGERESEGTCIIHGLQVLDINGSSGIDLPSVYSLSKLPVSEDDMIKKSDISAWPHLSRVEIAEVTGEVGILIGNDIPEAYEPWEIVHSPYDGAPFAVKTKLGWMVHWGRDMKINNFRINRIKVDDVSIDEMLRGLYNHDFKDLHGTELGYSQEDKQWLKIVEESCRLRNGQYEIALPLRDRGIKFTNNYSMALKRLENIKKKLTRNPRMHVDYVNCMNDMFSNGYAEPVIDGSFTDIENIWYIPHFGVYNPHKPEKIRIVFDCAAKSNGVSLNDRLLQGPDLTNSLLGVLLRFRQNTYAYSADIENMFHRVKVPENDRNLLRFLWYEGGQLDGPIRVYRMTVHLFGATSSPSCANYALGRVAEDNESGDIDISNTIYNNFYVDDCLMSLDVESQLRDNAIGVKQLCSLGGFNLTKFMGNSRLLMNSLPKDDLSKQMKDFDLFKDDLPKDKTLGLIWDVSGDMLSVKVSNSFRPATRRGILSTIGAVFDPLGIVAPFVLRGKLILQQLCLEKTEWDDELTGEIKERWDEWKLHKENLVNIFISRCLKDTTLSGSVLHELHYFSDASTLGYAAVCYLRSEDEFGHVCCRFVFGKAHVAPLKSVTIPRLELTAAVLAVRIQRTILRALNLPVSNQYFWTDSQTVLKYILNETARYHVFVANRVSEIRSESKIESWKYIASEQNPADDATRGIQSLRWCIGPSFLLENMKMWTESNVQTSKLDDDDPEVKKLAMVSKVVSVEDVCGKIIYHYSSWYKMVKGIAWLLRFMWWLQNKSKKFDQFISVKEKITASEAIVKLVQSEVYSKEINMLSAGKSISKGSSLYKLNVKFINGVLRVGGRLLRADISFDAKFPIVMPPDHKVTVLLIEEFHMRLGHQGREHVLSKLRERYWIIRGNSQVRKVLKRCVKCRRIQGQVVEQKMSDLPEDRLTPNMPPFSSVGVDCFGPYYVKHGRSQIKRYGIIFSCFATRAVHIEIASSLTTDSFINALRRFVARRGQVRVIRCDRGTNFTSAEKEIKKSIGEWKNQNIANAMLQRDIQWVFNPPYASHHGGSWERQIRTVRKVLTGVLTEQTFTEETLVTLMCEVESIINSRPLTVVSSDESDLTPITPNHLLTLEGGPQIFGDFDLKQYASKRWKHIQYLADLFWKRWRKEYLTTLQQRCKWVKKRQNLKIGDIVLLVDNTLPRGQWPLGRVCSLKTSEDNLVRTVDIFTQKGIVTRSISKLILIKEADN